MPLTHTALHYRDAESFLDVAVPFLREGVERSEHVLAVTAGKTGLLRRELAALDGAITYVDAADFYLHPARIVARVLALAEQESGSGGGIRLLGEQRWCGRGRLETAEWQRVEALVNLVFARTQAQILCAYDLALPASVLAAARLTHPQLADGAARLPNPGYLDPREYLSATDRRPLEPVPEHAALFAVHSPDLRDLRALISVHARRHGVGGRPLHQLLVAVTEVATNALLHGTPPVTLRLWPEFGRLVCEVADGGDWAAPEPETAGHVPPRADETPRLGLWAVRMLSGPVQVRTGPHGTRVRIHTPAAHTCASAAPARV